MRIIAALSWYDESPTWLTACVASAARLCDHVVALDGAYGLFPGGRPSSGPEQSAAIRLAAEAAGIGCTIHVPSEVWRGNEVHKRGHLFALAQLVAEPEEDWFLVIDADEILAGCDRNAAHAALAESDDLVAAIAHETYDDHTAQGEHLSAIEHRTSHLARRLFRAGPEPIRVEGQHWRYVRRAADGQDDLLWGRGACDYTEIPELRMEHRTHLRPPVRREAARSYYAIRDSLRIERAAPPVEVAA